MNKRTVKEFLWVHQIKKKKISIVIKEFRSLLSDLSQKKKTVCALLKFMGQLIEIAASNLTRKKIVKQHVLTHCRSISQWLKMVLLSNWVIEVMFVYSQYSLPSRFYHSLPSLFFFLCLFVFITGKNLKVTLIFAAPYNRKRKTSGTPILSLFPTYTN